VDEEAIAMAANRPEEAEVAKVAGQHGVEMLKLGYTLSHVVHAYGAMCQSITEIAEQKHFPIDVAGFHELNQCLDVAIAGAVTEYEKLRDSQEKSREDQHLGFLTHELRNALTSVTISLQLIKNGTVGLSGSTGKVLDRGLTRMQDLIDRSLTEVRLRVDPKMHIEPGHLLSIVDQILVSARVEAELKKQKLEVQIDPTLIIKLDQQAFHSALSNLIQNAIKFSHEGGKIHIRGNEVRDKVVVEVEDDCGGLPPNVEKDLFQAFKQKHENKSGLGLGLTIAERAIKLNHGTIEARNLPGKGCIFTITLPKATESKR
jgi:signal transduction histidine kinase